MALLVCGGTASAHQQMWVAAAAGQLPQISMESAAEWRPGRCAWRVFGMLGVWWAAVRQQVAY
jgi:hypothetical protein